MSSKMNSSSVLEQGWARYVGLDYCVPVARAQRAFLRGVTIPWVLYIPMLFILLTFKNSPITYIGLALWFCGTAAIAGYGLFELFKWGKAIRQDLAGIGVNADGLVPLQNFRRFLRWQKRNAVTVTQINAAAAVRFRAGPLSSSDSEPPMR